VGAIAGLLVEIERLQPLPLRRTAFLSIRGQAPTGFFSPHTRHTKEMSLQGRVTNFADQLHTN